MPLGGHVQTTPSRSEARETKPLTELHAREAGQSDDAADIGTRHQTCSRNAGPHECARERNEEGRRRKGPGSSSLEVIKKTLKSLNHLQKMRLCCDAQPRLYANSTRKARPFLRIPKNGRLADQADSSHTRAPSTGVQIECAQPSGVAPDASTIGRQVSASLRTKRCMSSKKRLPAVDAAPR